MAEPEGAGVVAQARAETRDAFVARFADTKLLVVRLDPAIPELAAGLARQPSDATNPWQVRSGLTDAGTVITPISEAFMKAAMASRSATRTLSPHKLKALLSTRPHAVVPLRKRRGTGMAERLTIGRSRSNDVTLHHPTVSKVHASLEYDEDALFLCDERSTNNTQLNGRVLESGEIAAFQEGDVIRFGEVEAIVCLPETLWDALSG